MNLTPKQKFAGLAAAIIAAIYAWPSIIHAIHPPADKPVTVPPYVFRGRQIPPSPVAVPASPGTPAASPAATLPAAAAANPFTPSVPALLGVWQGVVPVAGRGICSLKLELRRNTEDAALISGYPVIVCVPALQSAVQPTPANVDAALARFTPMSAILTGTSANGSIKFTVDKVIGAQASNCALTSFTVTPFGTNQIAAEWQEGSCGGGQMVLRKIGQ